MAIETVIPAQVVQYRYQLGIAISVSLVISLVLYAAPRLGTIAAYFWPLFASTTLFVVAIIAFTGVSHLAVEADKAPAAAEDIVDYVAGRHEYTTSTYHHQDQDQDHDHHNFE